MTFKMITWCALNDGSSGSNNIAPIEIDDDGEKPVVLAEAFDTIDTTEAVSCAGEITMERSVEGDLDPNYGAGGTIVGIQRRIIEFALNVD